MNSAARKRDAPEQPPSTNGRIASFAELNRDLPPQLVVGDRRWQTSQEPGFTLFYLLDTAAAPSVSVSLKVDRGLLVECFAGSGRIEARFLEALLPPRGRRLGSWGALAALLGFLGSDAIRSLSRGAEFYIGEALANLCGCLDATAEEGAREKLRFLINQVVLLKCNKTYTQHTVDKAFAIYIASSGCYRQIIEMGFLTLPGEVELLKLTGDWEEEEA